MSENKKMNDDLKKLNEKETDEVSGGVLGFGKDHTDGHELSCIFAYHSENECDKSPDGYHYWFKDAQNCNFVTCKYCRKTDIANPTAR